MKAIISSLFIKFILLFTLWLLFTTSPLLYAHGPDQVDHNFYLYININKLVIRWEIPVGEILGFIFRQKMDIDRDGIISKKEQDIFLTKFTEEHLQNISIAINNQDKVFTPSQTTIDITTKKVIPSPMTIKIFIEYNLPEKADKDNFKLYLKDEADKNITQFINFYTENNIQNVTIEKELINGEERIFKLSFTIELSSNKVSPTEQFKTVKTKTSKLYDTIKAYLSNRNIPIKISILLFGFAIILGVFHALEPGHGKSIMTAYILATKGTVLDVILLGSVVVITHTILVFILGLVTLYLSQYVLPQTIYPYLSFISSILIIILGLNVIRRSTLPNHTHSNNYHLIHTTPRYLKDIIQFGISGGLVPCPAAIAILLTAIQFNKIVTGVILIVALSMGIAITLIAIGITAVYTKKFILYDEYKYSKLQIFLPVISGIFITTLGTILLLKTFEETKIFKITL